MTDISDLLKSTMQTANCSSFCAFLLLKEENKNDEYVRKSADVSETSFKQRNKLGARN